MSNQHKFTNDLVHESSPYLLQHAHNPVNWKPWNKEVLNQAQIENKPIIVSIGYSACHWCHVMEHESFEDESVAKIMNEHFICIKVDREERPDIDLVYMSAVQLMTGQGGWPLNCITMSDGRPFYGGTYFKKDQWKNVLLQLVALYKDDHKKVIEYADRLTSGVHKADLIEKINKDQPFEDKQIDEIIENWTESFDPTYGGPNRAPKFMMPNNIEFLLYANYYKPNAIVKNHIELTLKKMAYGGIYDQVGGGFARYSVDQTWKVPHFEKMLYDNAQLISLYSKAYQATKNDLYKRIALDTTEFVFRELMHTEGYFYSALDADSEGVEGKFYVWTKEELEDLFPNDLKFLTHYYHIDSYGYWEDKNYILMRNKSEIDIATNLNITLDEVRKKAIYINTTLLEVREKRVRPGLDDKMITSWNGLMISALVDSYRAFGDKAHLNAAIKAANFITTNLIKKNNSLLHSYKNRSANISGFLEDYSLIASAFIQLFEVSKDLKWLKISEQLIDYCYENLFDASSGMFYFTDKNDAALIARKMEIMDNVIPASNSILANALFKLGHLTDNAKYLATAQQMLTNVTDQLIQYGSSFSNWGILLIHEVINFYEVALVGKENEAKKRELEEAYLPNCVVASSDVPNDEFALFENRFQDEITAIYVCVNQTCSRPTSSVKEAIQLIQRTK